MAGISGANEMIGDAGTAAALMPGDDKQFQPVNFAGFDGPRFIVTVDTEEEFDWSAPFSRDNRHTSHVPAIARFQTTCDEHGVRPAYLVDHPIVCDDAAVALLGGYAAAGKADIGVQLHPWVNPPFDEAVTVQNSFACNLPPELERAKLTALHNLIEQRFGIVPKIYRAGRYGAGANTRQILQDLGLVIDTSVRSYFDYSPHGGPNYSDYPLDPYWIADGSLMELPVTSVFSGLLAAGGQRVSHRAFKAKGLRGLMARSKLLERIALTPEGIPIAKAIKAVDIAIDAKIPILNFSLHSPSLAIGHTPYVRSERDLEEFYDWWTKIFAHLRARGVPPTHVDEIIGAAGIS
jgi:hypothetical protein